MNDAMPRFEFSAITVMLCFASCEQHAAERHYGPWESCNVEECADAHRILRQVASERTQ